MHNLDEDGIGPDELAELDRQAFRRALDAARSLYDPANAWEAFVAQAWQEAAPVFRINTGHRT